MSTQPQPTDSDTDNGPTQKKLDSQISDDFLRRLLKCLENLESSSKASEDGESELSEEKSLFSPDAQATPEIWDQVFRVFSEFTNYLQKEFPTLAVHEPRILVRTFSNSLQFICNGILHCSHQNEIYGSQVKSNEENLKEMVRQRNDLSNSCFEAARRNIDNLQKLNHDEIYELMEVSTECLALATDIPSLLPSVAKTFAVFLKQFQLCSGGNDLSTLLLGTSLIKQLRNVVHDLVSKPKVTNDRKIKAANYFGKLVLKFLIESSLNSPECLNEALDIAKLSEQANQQRKEGVSLIEFFPKIVASLMNVPNFVDEILRMTYEWEIQLRILVKSKLLPTCSGAYGISKILTSIFNDIICLATENLFQPTDLYGFVDDQILPQVCEFVRSLIDSKFYQIQKDIITYFIEDWTETYSLVVADLITNIFVFIVGNLNEVEVEEYLIVFSNSDLPAQFRYFIFPALSGKQNNLETDIAVIRRYEEGISRHLRNENGNPTAEDEKFFQLFWSQLERQRCDSVMDNILPLCVSTAKALEKLDETTTLCGLSAARQFLHRPNALSVLVSCTMLLGAKQLVFKKSEVWSETCEICLEIVKSCKKAKLPTCVAVFASKCVAQFINDATVESEDMILELKSRIEALRATKGTDDSQKVQVTSASNQMLQSNPDLIVPMFEKFTNTVIQQNMQLGEKEKERLSVIISQLTDFITKP